MKEEVAGGTGIGEWTVVTRSPPKAKDKKEEATTAQGDDTKV